MKFWRVEMHQNDGKFLGVACDVHTFKEAMSQARRFVNNNINKHCVVVKCGGTPLQCCIDGTKVHYVY